LPWTTGKKARFLYKTHILQNTNDFHTMYMMMHA